ncbi:MAG: hypothetical protein M3O22_01455 [Pseudomonadota bacterium]|nr:hypothetical protein [Pseudomonadota bacterium]
MILYGRGFIVLGGQDTVFIMHRDRENRPLKGHEATHLLQNRYWHDPNLYTENFAPMPAVNFEDVSAYYGDRGSPEAMRRAGEVVRDTAYRIEIQARLVGVMLEGEKFWGRKPATRAEFLAALIDLGCEVWINQEISKPGEITDREWEAARKTFSSSGILAASSHNRNLNGLAQGVGCFYVSSVYEDPPGACAAGASAILRFVTEIMPLLYGTALEMFGDTRGRMRMGFQTGDSPLAQHGYTGEKIFMLKLMRGECTRFENAPVRADSTFIVRAFDAASLMRDPSGFYKAMAKAILAPENENFLKKYAGPFPGILLRLAMKDETFLPVAHRLKDLGYVPEQSRTRELQFLQGMMTNPRCDQKIRDRASKIVAGLQKKPGPALA